MAYREVEMVEVREVVRLWLMGRNNTEIGKQVGVDRKTVRGYVRAAQESGLTRESGVDALTDEVFARLSAKLQPPSGRPRGAGWARCEGQHGRLEELLRGRVRLTKVHKLLARDGVSIPYATLHRYCVERLGFGQTAATIPVADGQPGEELQVDTGWVVQLQPGPGGRSRRLKAWIFTPNVSRYRFVYPCEQESTESAIEACEAAWAFYGGVFRVLVPDNTKAIIAKADALEPRITRDFLEYAQARGFQVDPARVRRPQDKARTERSVRYVREDCFGGELFISVEQARAHAERWCAEEAGMRRHSRTLRIPREHFETVEKRALLPAPTGAYDIPLWCDPKVGRDQLAQVAKALYSLPTHLKNKRLRARADRQLVQFYDGLKVVKVHARVKPGERSIDPNDYPAHKTAYALRDVAFLEKQAFEHGEAVGLFARALLAGPLPWTRMRQVHELLRLCKRYGDARVAAECTIALSVDLLDVRRLERIIRVAAPPSTSPPNDNVIPLARYLRPADTYAIRPSVEKPHTEDTHDAH